MQQRTVALWGQFVIILHASWLQHVTFHHFPRLALCKDLGWPAVYNTAHSAYCSSMKFLFIGGHWRAESHLLVLNEVWWF